MEFIVKLTKNKISINCEIRTQSIDGNDVIKEWDIYEYLEIKFVGRHG
jgi:hypothetical protein